MSLKSLSQHEEVHASVKAIASARSAGMFGVVCGMFIFFHHYITISAGVGGAYWFIALICDLTPRPRQS